MHWSISKRRLIDAKQLLKRQEINSCRVGLTYFDTNFGVIDIDWSQPEGRGRLGTVEICQVQLDVPHLDR